MTNIGIKHLFRNNRLPESDSKLILFILYLPLGFFLVVLRIVILCLLFIVRTISQESIVLQKLCNKLACLGLGISVHLEDSVVDENVEAYISNNISIFDHLAVSYATGSFAPNANKNIFRKLLQGNIYDVGNTQNTEDLKITLSTLISEKKKPLHFTPEEKPTNGKALLKFKTYPFDVTVKIQPICISAERPLIDMAITTMGSNYFSDMFYFMFCPLTNYKLKFLASLEKKSLSSDEFAEIARQNLATAIKVELSEFTSNDLLEWEKKQILERRQRSRTRPARSFNPGLHRMSLQVKEVLPHVPLNAIYNDLCITRSIDNTITNILEGRVNFMPEPSPASSLNTMSHPSTSSSSSMSTSDSLGASLKTSSVSFSKSASERSKSFQERKEQLIATARKRYIEKHNLKITL